MTPLKGVETLRVTNGGSPFTPEAAMHGETPHPGSWALGHPRMYCPTALRWPEEPGGPVSAIPDLARPPPSADKRLARPGAGGI